MTPDEERPQGGNLRASKAFDGAAPDATAPDIPAPRCAACGRLIAAERSLARGFGPECWTRLQAAQRVARHARVERYLVDLRIRLDALDADQLAALEVHLADALDVIGGA